MSRIDGLINELSPSGISYKTIGDICLISTGVGITKKMSISSGKYPIISGGLYPMGYYNEFNRNENTVTVARAGSAGLVNFLTQKFYLNDKCFSLIPNEMNNHLINPKFLFYYLKSNEGRIVGLRSSGSVPTINSQKLKRFVIPVPPLEVQNEIVRILDNFSALEAELEAELEARTKQYNYYLNKLLDFSNVFIGVHTIDRIISTLCPKGISYKPIGEIGILVRGNGLQRKDFTETGTGCIHYGQIYTYYGMFPEVTKSFVSNELARTLKKVDQYDLIITNTSENLEDVCKAVVWMGSNQIVTGGHATILKHKENPKFIAYYLQTSRFNRDKQKYANGTKVIDVSANNLAKIEIPVPPIEIQNEIVKILDNFSTYVSSLSEGLPAEISARRQQYEYYRNKLLTF